MSLILDTSLYILAFVAIWYGAGLIVKSVDIIAKTSRVSSFAIAFFLLGILTSIPETAVGINAILNKTPEIFIGSLLGGTLVIFLLIIPILAIFGQEIKLNHDLDKKNLIMLLIMLATPGMSLIDHKITQLEGILLVLGYLLVFYSLKRKDDSFREQKSFSQVQTKPFTPINLLRASVGVVLVIVSSQFIVKQTLVFANIFQIPAYYISLLALSLGTNLPELSLAVRATLSNKKDIAFGDYLGSAAANTLLFGIFSTTNKNTVLSFNGFLITLIFVSFGLGLFYFFSQTKHNISRKEGIILISIYILFIIYELNKGMG